MHKVLREALAAVGNAKLTWYQATRHTFGSHWVMDGGSLEKLRVELDAVRAASKLRLGDSSGSR